MSTETVFSALSYPAIHNPARDRAEEEARTRGHAAGYAAGAAQARREAAVAAAAAEERSVLAAEQAEARVRSALNALNTAVSTLNTRTVPVLETMEAQVASAAVEIAEALLGRELSTAEDSGLSALQRALNPDVPGKVHTIRMNPADLAAIPENTRAEVNASLVGDPSLASGDAVAEYPNGFLDARLSSALIRLKSAIEGAA